MPTSVTRRRLLTTAVNMIGATTMLSSDVALAQQSESPWPQFQYDAGNTGYTTAVEVPDAEHVQRRWRYNADGSIVGAPVVGNGSIYVGDGSGNVNAVDLETGERQWTFPAGGNPKVALLDDTIVAVSGCNTGSCNVRALDPENGAEQWIQEDVGSRAPLTITNNLLFVGGAAALNPNDGSIVWETDQGDSQIAPAVADSTLYTPTAKYDQAELAAINAGFGDVAWTGSLGPNDGTNASPVATENRVYASSSNGSRVRVPIRVYTPEGEQITRLSDSVEGNSLGIALGDGLYYVATSGLEAAIRAFNTETGTEEWSFKVRESEAAEYDGLGTPPIVVGEHLYAVNGLDGNRVYAFDAASGERVWTHQMETGVHRNFEGLAAAGGALFIGDSSGNLYAIENRTADTPTVASDTDAETEVDVTETESPTTVSDDTTETQPQTTTSRDPSDKESARTTMPTTATSDQSADEASSAKTEFQRGFIANNQIEGPLAFIDSFLLTVGGFVLSVIGIFYQLLEGED